MSGDTAIPHCPGCGHFRSHEPKTAQIGSGMCPDCHCLSGWQSPSTQQELVDFLTAETESAILGVRG